MNAVKGRQTILGAGGAIGTPLAKELRKYTDKVRLVSRHPRPVDASDELFPADLSVATQVNEAVKGSGVVYLTVGFKYSRKVWRDRWPRLMRAVINACMAHQARLVFFDNVYMYDPSHMGRMTEDTPVRPISKKGQIRAEVAQMIMNHIDQGTLTALIARSADFYGPKNSMLVEMVYKRLAQRKRALWIADIDKIYTPTFIPDAAAATAMLGNTPDAYNQVWNLPTDHSPLTVRQWIEMFASNLNVEPKAVALPIWSLTMLGMFTPIMRELKEMSYQYNRDYVFDSSKFEQHFKASPTAPEEGVKWILDQVKV
jgi:nucleoside-diphosphate-sugar epimerase